MVERAPMVAQQGDELMRTMMVLMAMCAGCVAGGERAAVQEVTGVTVTVRDAGQLAVSWSPDPVAARYLVYQSAGGALPALVATVFDSGGGVPSTSWIATGLTGGVEYCYSIRSGFADGGIGAPGAGACAVASGGGPAGLTISAAPMSPGNNNNWTTAGFATASTIRIGTGSGFPFLTGLSGGVDGRTLTLVMASIGDPLTVTRLDGSSQASNQLLLPLPAGAVYLQMTAVDQAITLVYDGIASKWRIVARNF